MTAGRSTLELTESERWLLHNALETYLSDFGHEDYDLIVAARQLIARLDAVNEPMTTEAAG